MKTVCKKLLSLTLVAMLLVSAVPFQAFATEGETTAVITETAPTIAETQAVTEPSVETTAATEAPTEAPTEATTVPTEAAPAVETTPAPSTVGDTITVVFTLKQYPQAVIHKQENAKIGYKVNNIPNNQKVYDVYAQYDGSTSGKVFLNWELADGTYFDPSVTNITDSIATPGSTLYLYAVVVDKAQTIKLDAKGGKLNNSTHQAILGQTYGGLSSLPVPTREHYDFQYWYKLVNGVEVMVDNSTVVVNNWTLYAKWALANYNVTFQRYDGSAWVDVDSSIAGGSVPAQSTITNANYFPTDSEINNNFALSGYKIVGWEIGETDKAFTAGKTKVTGDMVIRPRYQRTITLLANNPDAYTSNGTKSITVEIGEPIPTLPNPGARQGYTFVDWVTEDLNTVISSKANLSNVAAHPLYYPALGTTFHARWTESTVVYLYIHTNGNTQTATKIVPYYEAPTHGAFDTGLINMYAIFSDYGNYDDNVDASYGWYDATQWKNYCANTAANAADVFYDIKDNNYVELHIMLINNGTGTNNNVNNNNYNNNNSTADPSNPTTGDTILMAVTVMAISATALALVIFLKKRKAC